MILTGRRNSSQSKSISMLFCQQFYQFIYTNIFFTKKLGPMHKSHDSSPKYCSNATINRKRDPILIEDSNLPSYQTKDDRRLTSQREDSNQRHRIPLFLRQIDLPKTTYKKAPQYSETTKSLIVFQKERRFRQSKDSKHNYMTASNKNTPYITTTQYPKDSGFSTKKEKTPVQNLTFDNFLEMAKKQKDRNIPTYTLMCNPKPARLPYKTEPYIFQQLRQTEDTIPENLIFLQNHSPKVTDFHQVKLLGKGKNGEVYLAIHKATGFACAMKIIKKKDINRGTTVERQIMYNQLLRQIKIQMYLSHPNLIELYCVFCDKQNIYLIQQLGINGQLYELMRKKNRLSEQSTALISREILSGLKAMHQKNIIHRDIKPQNIVLVYGIAKICDFGWSVYCPVQLRSTLCGTPLYLSPQVLIGEDYNYKIDIWAYGTLVYELFTGDNPFKIKNKSDLKKIVTDDLVFAQTFPRRLRSFLQMILNKNSSQRPQAKQIQQHEFLRKYAELQTSDELANI